MTIHTSQRTGAVLPLIAVFITAFLLLAALTINSNWFMFNHTNAQNTADISARASLNKILADSKSKGRFKRARDLGVRLYDLNYARSTANFDTERIRFGNVVDSSVADPEFIESFDEDDVVSAVHVDSPVQLEQQQVEVFFSNLLGSDSHVKIFADAKASARSVDIMLCLDASRSMNLASDTRRRLFPPGGRTIHERPLPGSRWFELTETVGVFLAAMQETNPNARVGLVTFGGGASWRRRPFSELDDDFARFEKEMTVVIASDISDITKVMESYAIDHPALGLGTSLYEGIKLSLSSFPNDTDSVKHIVMLSDGQQAAVNSPRPVLAARDAARQNVTIHTIAFGSESIDDLEDIASETGGSVFAAISEKELKEAFAKLLGRFRVQLVD